MPPNRNAASTRLEPGQDSIERNTPTPRTRKGKTRYILDWSIRLHDDRFLSRRTQGETKAAVRARARSVAKELLKTNGLDTWKGTSKIEDFIDQVTYAEIINNSGLAASSVRAYTDIATLLRNTLKGRSITATMYLDVLQDALDEIGHKHGPVRAKQAKSVLSRYIISPLRQRRVIDQNPLQDHRLDLSMYPNVHDRPKRGGQALSLHDHMRVIDYLRKLDPAEGVVQPQRGRWSLQNRINRRRNVINLTILQAGAGLRISEALQVTPLNVLYDEHGRMQIQITRNAAKTSIARVAPVLIPEVEEHMNTVLERITEDHHYLFPIPSDPAKCWRADGSTGANHFVSELYNQIAEDLDIPVMTYLRSHLWRATLTSRCKEAGIPREQFAAILGHDTKTNERSYTAAVDVDALTSVFRGEGNA